MSRQGKHKEGKVSIGLYVDADFRALIALVVDQSGETMTDVIMAGVREKATSLSIMRDGQIVDEYKPAIEVIKAAFASKKKGRK
jgi:hypothetical protein